MKTRVLLGTAVVLLVSSILAALTADLDRGQKISPGTPVQPSLAAATQASGALVYLLPGYLPGGLDRSPTTLIKRPVSKTARGRFKGIVIGKPQRSQSYTGVIRISIEEAAADREPGDPDEFELERVNGVKARVFDSPIAGSSADWFDRGLAVGLKGGSGEREVVLDVARALKMPTSRNAHDVKLESLPRDYVVLSEEKLTPPTAGEPGDVEQSYNLPYVGNASQTLFIFVSYAPAYSLSPVWGAPGTNLKWIDVRGTKGVLATSVVKTEGGSFTQSVVSWAETVDVRASVMGSEPKQVLRVAEGLMVVSEAHWLEKVDPQEQG